MREKPLYIPLYASVWELTRGLDDGQIVKLFNGICEYGFEGRIPDFSDDKILEAVFTVLKPNYDAHFSRYYGGKKSGRK